MTPETDARALLAEVARVRADAEAGLAAAADAAAVEALRHELLGRSGSLTALLRQVASVSAEERPAVGTAANEARQAIEAAIAERLTQLESGELETRLAAETIDMSGPGRPVRVGHLHPLMTVERDLREIFHGFGFEVVESAFGGRAVFMRAAGGANHHDLGLFSVGEAAPRPPRGSTGLYHLAWEVPTIDDLATAARTLSEAGALGGSSDHGVSKSLYGADPDGNEFEVMWMVPREQWGEFENAAPVAPLNLQREVDRFGSPGV